MPSKILLISTNRCTSPDPVFPLGLAFVNAALRRAGHGTRWLDCQLDGERPHQRSLRIEPLNHPNVSGSIASPGGEGGGEETLRSNIVSRFMGTLEETLQQFQPDLVGISLRNID